MGKYDPLASFLRRQKADTLELTFSDIERRIRALLPKAAFADAWWTAEGVQTRAWGQAGFSATLLAGSERVRFERSPLTAASQDVGSIKPAR